jgi:hypothetical protein
VTKGYGSLVEVETQWDLCNLMDAHEAIEIEAEAQEFRDQRQQ